MTEPPRTEEGPEPPEDEADAASPLRSDALDAELGMLEAMLPAEGDEPPNIESSSPAPADEAESKSAETSFTDP